MPSDDYDDYDDCQPDEPPPWAEGVWMFAALLGFYLGATGYVVLCVR